MVDEMSVILWNASPIQTFLCLKQDCMAVIVSSQDLWYHIHTDSEKGAFYITQHHSVIRN